ncbi:hypothetical protein PYCC9005_005404 [Savitreella phatthalungensis]
MLRIALHRPLPARHSALLIPTKAKPVRRFGWTSLARNAPTQEQFTPQELTRADTSIYTAPLATTVRNIKIFSVSSFAASAAISPMFFLIDSEIDIPVRVALVGIAVATSALSTGVIAWVLKPYVVSGKLLGEQSASVTRLDLLGRRYTSTITGSELKIDRNGRMFANLRGNANEPYYIHETSGFWKHLGLDSK